MGAALVMSNAVRRASKENMIEFLSWEFVRTSKTRRRRKVAIYVYSVLSQRRKREQTRPTDRSCYSWLKSPTSKSLVVAK